MEKDKSISEDDLHGYMGDIQDLTDQHIEQINQQLQKKEQRAFGILANFGKAKRLRCYCVS